MTVGPQIGLHFRKPFLDADAPMQRRARRQRRSVQVRGRPSPLEYNRVIRSARALRAASRYLVDRFIALSLSIFDDGFRLFRASIILSRGTGMSRRCRRLQTAASWR
jgi:hypothetical protein